MSPGANATAPTAKQFFLICAWNGLPEPEKGSPLIWQKDPTAAAIASYLTAHGWDELPGKEADNKSAEKTAGLVAEAESKADLIVVVPRDHDKPFSLDELTVFHAGLGGKRKKRVLYIHIAGHSPLNQGRMSDWLFRVSRAEGVSDALEHWLNNEKPEFDDGVQDFSFQKQYGTYITREENLEPSEEEWPSRTARQLIKSNSQAQFFFGLWRIGKRYNRLEHDLNAEESDATTDPENIKKKKYLGRCFDLHDAITARCMAEIRKEDEDERLSSAKIPRNVVLLIDDHPERHDCAKNIKKAIDDFLPGFEFWIWNTETSRKIKAAITQEEIENFSSWSELRNKKIAICEKPDDKNGNCKELILVLARTRVVLVDVLFHDAGGDDIEAGYGIIRGIHRLCRDRHNEVEKYIRETVEETEKGEKNPDKKDQNDERPLSWELPEIIAISRASDFAKAHAAYRCGAGGYLMKERWLGLPGMIAAAIQPTFDHAGIAHRNFRLLYNLPHRTMGLLRSCRVPCIAFHNGKQEGPENEKSASQRLASLLSILPKADLHVHPGSCMSPEYLVVASLIMLLRHDPEAEDPKEQKKYNEVQDTFRLLNAFANNTTPLKLLDGLAVVPFLAIRNITDRDFPEAMAEIAKKTRDYLKKQIKAGDKNRTNAKYLRLRSILHKGLGLPDHHDKSKILSALKGKQHSALFFFALLHSTIGGEPIKVSQDDLLRCFILFLSARGPYTTSITIQNTPIKPSELLKGAFPNDSWKTLHNLFYDKKGKDPADFGVVHIRDNNWRLLSRSDIKVKVSLGDAFGDTDYLADCPEPKNHPIAWLLASGTRSTNLLEYLDGCEFSGAEHLQHPFLTHLFAQQTVYEFIRHGVLYAELRTALSGYENSDMGISFSDACNCFGTAMGQAQQIALSRYQEKKETEKEHPRWLWQGRFAIDDLFNPFKDELAKYRFPCKVSVILTGKRHKSSRMLVREAGAGAVLHGRPPNPASTARDFVEKAIGECRVVGFDLAGQEDQNHPQKFRAEYEQIARLHIPVTVHAGENAPSGFVESAILDLRARRLGHGLALAEDKALMERARDDGICVELCPVSNFQTNAVYPHRESKPGREYPLKMFMENGLSVTINTDNPIISYTNMVKECFQTSYAYGAPGLTLWDILRILRSGFVNSFLTQPERHALLELVDQLLFDLFSRPGVVDTLRVLPK